MLTVAVTCTWVFLGTSPRLHSDIVTEAVLMSVINAKRNRSKCHFFYCSSQKSESPRQFHNSGFIKQDPEACRGCSGTGEVLSLHSAAPCLLWTPMVSKC